MELSQSEAPSGLPPVYLHPTLVVELGGTSSAPVSVRDRLILSTPQSRAERNASGRKKPQLWIPLFPLLQMGANHFRTIPLKCILKNLGQVWFPEFKKTCLIFFCDIEWPQYPLEDREWWPVERSLNYDTILHLDRFHRKQEKWVEVPYVLLFISLQDMPDLCPKGADLGVKPSAPSCPLTLPLYLGLQLNRLRVKGTLSGGDSSVSVEIQTIPTVVQTF